MPPEGYTAITIPTSTKNRMVKLAKRENLSIQKYLAKILDNVEAQKT